MQTVRNENVSCISLLLRRHKSNIICVKARRHIAMTTAVLFESNGNTSREDKI